MSRYLRRSTAINNFEQYDKMLEERGVTKVEQYRTPKFKYFDENDIRQVDYINYVWRHGGHILALGEKNSLIVLKTGGLLHHLIKKTNRSTC